MEEEEKKRTPLVCDILGQCTKDLGTIHNTPRQLTPQG